MERFAGFVATLTDAPVAFVAISFGAGQLQQPHTASPGEPLNIVAHSHGGHVVKEYTNMSGAQKIDNLVTLGTPQRSDYELNAANVLNYVNVYSKEDSVQVKGGGFAEGDTTRTDPAATNFEVSRVGTAPVSHSDLHTPSVWQRVRELFK